MSLSIFEIILFIKCRCPNIHYGKFREGRGLINVVVLLFLMES